MKKQNKGESVPISFRLNKEDYEKVMKLKELAVKQLDWIKPIRIVKSDFFRMVFDEGMKSMERKLRNKGICEKCGKRLPISVPKHLRERLDVCECGEE